MKRLAEPSDIQRLGRLAAHLPVVASEHFQVGVWEVPQADISGIRALTYFVLTPEMEELIATAYDDSWVLRDFDWQAWASTPEAVRLREDPSYLLRASIEQLEKFLTLLVRQERFSEGSLAAAHENGLLVRILRRAAALAYELESGKR
jgi:hypothetical protein